MLSGENLPDTPLLVPRQPPCGAVGQTRFSALNPNNQTAAAEPGDRQALWLCFSWPRHPAHTASLVSPQAGEQGGQAACAVASLSLLPGRGPPSGLWVKGWSSLALLLSGTGSCRLQDRREGTHISGIRFWKRGWWERGVGWGGPPLGTGPPWSGSRCFYAGARSPEPVKAQAECGAQASSGPQPCPPGVSVSLFIGGVNYHVQFFSFQIILYLFKKSLLKYKI